MILTDDQFQKARDYAFSASNRGYRPLVQESPDGNGIWDDGKRFAHVGWKYGFGNCAELCEIAWRFSREVCETLGVPRSFWPVINGDSTLRVLDYPPGSGSSAHTDFNLFTLSLYRKKTQQFRYLGGNCPELAEAKKTYPGIHFGELLTEIMGWPATRHSVEPCDEPTEACVYFVVPPWGAVLPSGLTVGEWMTERKGRSRRVA